MDKNSYQFDNQRSLQIQLKRMRLWFIVSVLLGAKWRAVITELARPCITLDVPCSFLVGNLYFELQDKVYQITFTKTISVSTGNNKFRNC